MSISGTVLPAVHGIDRSVGLGRSYGLGGEDTKRELSQHQFDVDYGRWERTRTPSAHTARLPAPHASNITVGPRPRPTSETTPSATEMRLTGVSSRRSDLASACRDIWANARNVHDSSEDQAERVRLIKLKIQARKWSIHDYKRRAGELMNLNQRLRHGIEKEESVVHDGVKILLRRYDKFRGCISVLNSKFGDEYSEADHDLNIKRSWVNRELSILRKKVRKLDKELVERQKEADILMNYKDKEYPAKTIEMNDLKKELDTLEVVHDDEQDELETIVSAQLDKMKQSQECVRSGIIADVTEDYLGQMHPTLQDMALQNLVMKKEIGFHEREMVMLSKSNEELERKVKALRRGNETKIRLQVYPHLYVKPQCTPDMDVVLNIHKQEWLPI